MTVNFCRILETLPVGPTYLAMSAAASFRDLTIFPGPLLLDNDLSHIELCDTIVQMKPQLFLAWLCHWRYLFKGHPNVVQTLMYLSNAPHLHQVELELGVEEVVPGEPTPIWLCRGCRLEKWPRGTHPPPLRKVTPGHPEQDTHFLLGFPKVLVEGFWGCIQLMEYDLSTEIFHKLAQFTVCQIPQVHLEMLWHSLRWEGVTSG